MHQNSYVKLNINILYIHFVQIICNNENKYYYMDAFKFKLSLIL